MNIWLYFLIIFFQLFNILANVNGLYLASLLSIIAEELHLLLEMVIFPCSQGHVTKHFDHLFQDLGIQTSHDNGKESLN